MHPPHQPKPNDFGRKIRLHFGEDLFFFALETPEFGRKKRLKFREISPNSGEDLFFGDHLILGGKNVRISDFGRKISLNFSEDIRIFEVLCLEFLLSPPTKIFWIRHCPQPLVCKKLSHHAAVPLQFDACFCRLVLNICHKHSENNFQTSCDQ